MSLERARVETTEAPMTILACLHSQSLHQRRLEVPNCHPSRALYAHIILPSWHGEAF